MDSLEFIVSPEELAVFLLVRGGEEIEFLIEKLTELFAILLQLDLLRLIIVLETISLLLKQSECFRMLLGLLLEKLLSLFLYLILALL